MKNDIQKKNGYICETILHDEQKIMDFVTIYPAITQFSISFELIEYWLDLLQYLCISTETLDVVVQCYKQNLKKHIDIYFAGYQVNLNERQLNDAIEFLMNVFEIEKITICKEYAYALATISSQLGGKQLDNALQYEDNRKKCAELIGGWDPFSFLTFRIFLIFEIYVRIKREGRNFIGLPRDATFKKLYEKGIKELQVQLTTYWDYVTIEEFKHKCPDLMNDWDCNVVNRLMNLKLMSSNLCFELSLVVGYEGHCIYLSLCKTLDYVLVRVDNRWMDTVPLDTSHPKNGALIQSYLVAYFKLNGFDIDKNKE
ncbi:hypothetical protein RFI_36058 [Reticulomyxa filosa]|uniref:Uncharacterized protein n=1 Tax=Reticulomyxa filosa TaxID=46433 RepID=X6LJT8_RETFI|nr:hypothetical protein RFI_36058 [Reticulomyxa filosa]|eukprot:ETO01382.1 hypothetical protein RFI_36058 [Reticulomyxa filosa]